MTELIKFVSVIRFKIKIFEEIRKILIKNLTELLKLLS